MEALRFTPEKTPANRVRWWAAVLVGGPGWVLPGVAKMLGGALLAYLALTLAVPADRVVDPNLDADVQSAREGAGPDPSESTREGAREDPLFNGIPAAIHVPLSLLINASGAAF